MAQTTQSSGLVANITALCASPKAGRCMPSAGKGTLIPHIVPNSPAEARVRQSTSRAFYGQVDGIAQVSKGPQKQCDQCRCRLVHSEVGQPAFWTTHRIFGNYSRLPVD